MTFLIFVLTFWACGKDGLIGNIGLVYDVTVWLIMNYSTHIVKNLTN